MIKFYRRSSSWYLIPTIEYQDSEWISYSVDKKLADSEGYIAHKNIGPATATREFAIRFIFLLWTLQFSTATTEEAEVPVTR